MEAVLKEVDVNKQNYLKMLENLRDRIILDLFIILEEATGHMLDDEEPEERKVHHHNSNKKKEKVFFLLFSF